MYFPDYREQSPERGQPAPPLSGDQIQATVLELKRAGASPDEILQRLMDGGVDHELAMRLTSEVFSSEGRKGKRRRIGRRDPQAEKEAREARQLERAYQEAMQSAGRRNMLVGGIICVVGLLVTLGTLAAAGQGGGGRYIIAWGAIVFGAIQFFRGLGQMQNHK
jgi:hypothetical protein